MHCITGFINTFQACLTPTLMGPGNDPFNTNNVDTPMLHQYDSDYTSTLPQWYTRLIFVDQFFRRIFLNDQSRARGEYDQDNLLLCHEINNNQVVSKNQKYA